MIWIEFIICAVLIIAASTVLSRYGDVIAEKTGLGRAWVGGILLASVTSLPELVSGVTAVTWLNAPNLAVGSILGSCLFNILLIALMDLAYQPGSILAKAQEGHILSAGMSVLLLGAVVVGTLAGTVVNGFGLLGFSLVSAAIVILYFMGARLIALFEQKRIGEVLEKSAEVRQYDQISLGRTYGMFLLSAGIIVVLGVWLSSIGDRLATETGLSRSFVGSLFLAASTSLPEVATSLAAVRLGAIDLAISNALGSNLFNVLLLAVFDLFDGSANLWAAVNGANVFAAVATVMMTAVVIVSLIYRASPRTPYRISWDGVALMGMYVSTLAVIYWLG